MKSHLSFRHGRFMAEVGWYTGEAIAFQLPGFTKGQFGWDVRILHLYKLVIGFGYGY